MRFAALRETASWVEGFDDAWWPAIDAAYEAYDRSIDGELVARWDAFCADAADERIRGQTPDQRRARAMWSRYIEIDRALGERERAFADALMKDLPRAAAPFVELLAARSAFRRATGVLREPGQELPAPLEVMQLVQRRMIPAEALAAVTASYARLTGEAEAAVRQRANAYIETCGDMEAISIARREAEMAERNAPDEESRKKAIAARERHEKEGNGRTKQWEVESLRAVERLRLALQREGRAFAQMLGDPAVRSDYLDQLDFALHDGIRAAKGIDAFARIARATIVQVVPDGTERKDILARLDALVEQEVARQRTARVALSSASPAARRRAYEELQKTGDPVGELVGKVLQSQGGIWRVLERTPDVMAGVQSAEAAAAAILDPSPEPPAPPRPFVPPGRDRNLQLLFGSPLVPSSLAALSARLSLSPDAQRTLDALIEQESKELEEAVKGTGPAIMREFEKLDPRTSDASPKTGVARFMGKLSGIISRQRALDAAANERVLSEAARLAGVEPDDERIELTRLELDLLLDVGVDRDTRDSEPIAGASACAVLNPLELARIAARNEDERVAAEAILFLHAEALRAAHRDLVAEIRRNLAGFLEAAIEMQSVSRASDRWRPALAGGAAVRLRLALADEFRAALGDEFAARYEAELRDRVAPLCEPKASELVGGLERFARGAGGNPADPDWIVLADDRAVVDEWLAERTERRAESLRRFVAWRANWVRIGDYGDRDAWRQLERASPRGWMLHSRISDADERAIAMCAMALDPAASEELGLRRFAVVIPRRLKPYFE